MARSSAKGRSAGVLQRRDRSHPAAEFPDFAVRVGPGRLRECDRCRVVFGIEIVTIDDMATFIQAEETITSHDNPPDVQTPARLSHLGAGVCRKPDTACRSEGEKSPLGRSAHDTSPALDEQSTIERAFILAETGSCRTVNDIRAQLKKEQREAVDAHLAGPLIQRQLKERLTAKLSG